MSDAFFRASVGAVVIDRANEVLTLRRSLAERNTWQMPQGAIWFGETPIEALHRELKAKLSLTGSAVCILAATGWQMYEVPNQYRNSKIGWGQVQKWFLCRLSAQPALIAPNMLEFEAHRWVNVEEVVARAAPFKKDLYARVLAELMVDTQRTCTC